MDNDSTKMPCKAVVDYLSQMGVGEREDLWGETHRRTKLSDCPKCLQDTKMRKLGSNYISSLATNTGSRHYQRAWVTQKQNLMEIQCYQVE